MTRIPIAIAFGLAASSGFLADTVVSGASQVPLREAIGVAMFATGLVIYIERRMSRIESAIHEMKTQCKLICKLRNDDKEDTP